MGPYDILRCCILEHEHSWILNEAHASVTGGYSVGKYTVPNILQEGLWWPIMHADNSYYYRICDVCQRTEKSFRRDEIPLVPHITLQEFDKWVVDFVEPIILARKRTRA